MEKQTASLLFKALGEQCTRYLDELEKKSKEEILDSSFKTAFVLVVSSFVSSESNLALLDKNKEIGVFLEGDTLLEELFEYGKYTLGYLPTTNSSIVNFLEDFCTPI